MKNQRTTAFLVSFFILLSTIFRGYFYKVSHEQKVSLPVLGNPGHHVEPFSFVNQDGKAITNNDVKGKVCVVEYFFTTCRGICPKMNEHMTNIAKAFRGNKSV